MKVTHVLVSGSQSWGGPPQAANLLSRGLRKAGVDSRILALAPSPEETVRFSLGVQVEVFRGAPPAKVGIPCSTTYFRALARSMADSDIIHIHEIWHLPNLLAAICAMVTERPYIVSPHGALDAWSLSQRKDLKRLAWTIYQKPIFDLAAGVHVLTKSEEMDVLSRGIVTRLRVIPSGVDLHPPNECNSDGNSDLKTPDLPARYILSLGRLDRKKGLDVLLDAAAISFRKIDDVALVVAGPDPHHLWTGLQRRAEALGMLERVRYLGYVTDSVKHHLLSRALLFILPSLSEGLSLSVLEALACGTPVVISPGCHVPEVQAVGAGRVVPPTPSAVAASLTDLLTGPGKDERESMGRRARTLAESKFSLEATAAAMLSFYGEVLRT